MEQNQNDIDIFKVLKAFIDGFFLTYFIAAVLFAILLFGIMPLLSPDY